MNGAPETFLTPQYFAEHGYPWEGWASLRKDRPVCRVDGDRYEPFWAVTRHEDIVRVSRDPHLFLSQPGNTLMLKEMQDELMTRPHPLDMVRDLYRAKILFRPSLVRDLLKAGARVRESGNPGDAIQMLLNQDPPEHRTYRDTTRRHFTPRALDTWRGRVDHVARETVAKVAKRASDPRLRDEPFDFVSEIAAPFPLKIIAELMGLPESDHDQLFEWSNAIVGIEDPDYGDAENPLQAASAAQLGLFGYFAKQFDDRRRHPGNDLITILAESRIDGKPMSQLHALSYCFLMVVAGNETTRNALSGGMAALMAHPDEYNRLRDDPSLMETAPDEIVRWSSPVIYFLRTAARDCEVGGQAIAAGDRLALYYPSANRDESVFPDPERFDIGRKPNRHIGFGIGEHFCLGAHIARREIRSALEEIIGQLPNLEPAGPISRVHSDFVGGIKALPVRFAS